MASETAALSGSEYQRKTVYGSTDQTQGQYDDSDIILEPTDQKANEVTKQVFEEYRMCAHAYRANNTSAKFYMFIGTISWAVGIAGVIINIWDNKSPFSAPVITAVSQGALWLGIGFGKWQAMSDLQKV